MFLLLKDRVAVEPNSLIRDTASSKEVAHSLRYQDNNLERTGIKNVCFIGAAELDN
jgi:hypothetical protein